MHKRKLSTTQEIPRKGKRTKYASQPRTVTQDYRIISNPRAEFKIWDKDIAIVSNTSTGAIFSLQTAGNHTAALSRGSDYYQNFIGQNLNIAGVQLRYLVAGAISNALLTADQYNNSRFMFFQWMDSTTPTVSGVLQNSTVFDPTLATNRPILNVLYDKITTTWAVHSDQSSGTTGDVSSTCYNYKKYFKGHKFAPIQMDTGSATYQKGGLYVLIISDSAAAPNPQCEFSFRVTFTD